MNLKDTMEQFLDTISESSTQTYKSKIYVFYDFLTSEKGINDKSYQSYLEAMKINEVEESLDYYIMTNEIKSESIAWHFISVIKRYFSFIYRLGIQNVNLLKSFGLSEEYSDSFQAKIREKIFNDSRLEKKDSKSEISWEEAEILISECDQRMKELIDEGKILDYKEYASKYNDYLSSLIIKLILFTGIPYRVVRDIKYSNLNIVHNTVCINDYSIHLPNKISEQLAFYTNVRNEIKLNSKAVEDTLFIYANGSKLRTQTDVVAGTLKEYMGRSDLTGIIKFAIIQMIKKGINQSIVQDFTKVGDPIYKYCQKQVNANKNSSASRYLDSKLRSLEMFDIL